MSTELSRALDDTNNVIAQIRAALDPDHHFNPALALAHAPALYSALINLTQITYGPPSDTGTSAPPDHVTEFISANGWTARRDSEDPNLWRWILDNRGLAVVDGARSWTRMRERVVWPVIITRTNVEDVSVPYSCHANWVRIPDSPPASGHIGVRPHHNRIVDSEGDVWYRDPHSSDWCLDRVGSSARSTIESIRQTYGIRTSFEEYT